jgi:cytochrome P450
MFNFRKNTPPGPSLFSMLGDTPSNVAELQLNMALKYGDVCKAPGLLGYYLLSHPDYIEHVLKTNHKNYLKTDLAYKGMASVLGQGLLPNSDHDDWIVQRRHLQPLFQPQTLQHLAFTTIETTLNFCNRWETYAKQNKAINLFPEMLQLVFAITSKTLFNDNFTSHSEQFLRFSELGNAYISKCLFLYPWLPTIHNLRFKKSQKEVEQFILAIIQQRRAHPATQPDLLTTLLSIKDETTGANLSDRRIVDEVKTFLMTGSETTGTALAWIWYCLANNPAVAQQLQQELNDILQGNPPTPDDVEKLSYTRMVVEEGLRLYPPVWMISRRTQTPDMVGNYRIPANKTIIVSPYTMQRHPAYWDEPEKFNPLRFTEENKKKRPKFVYFPFGVGPRTCIGAAYAVVQAQLILATIAQQYDFTLCKKRPIKPQLWITLRPKNGVKVKIRKK